jgi:hypothetical protein
LVGEKWLGPQAGGKLRIMNDADPVRVELETALKRNITVLPVLLDGTSMPDPADLPEGIRDAYRNAIAGRIRPWARLDSAARPIRRQDHRYDLLHGN